MFDIRNDKKEVKKDKRKDPRLECHCDATVLGLTGIQTITDISLGGFYLKGDIPDRFETGQNKIINVKLPSEKYVTRFKAKIMRKTYRGIGCQLANRNGFERDTLSNFFKFYNFFSDINLKYFE